MSDASSKAADVMDVTGEILAMVGQRGGAFGLGLLAAGAILKTSAKAIKERGMSVDEILARVRTLGAVEGPWASPTSHDATSDTFAETPRAKRKE
jgi:hypothetical protein